MVNKLIERLVRDAGFDPVVVGAHIVTALERLAQGQLTTTDDFVPVDITELLDRAGVPFALLIAWGCATAALLVALAGRANLGAERYRGKHEVRHAGARQVWRARRIL